MGMFDLARVVGVRHIGGHLLWLKFSDGVEGTVELGACLNGPMLEPLRDPARFAAVALGESTIVWPNGVDWAPETLHDLVLATKQHDTQARGDGGEVSGQQFDRVPEISRFFGIVIRMFFDEHARPHLHAQYGEHAIAIEIAGNGVRGSFPPARLPMLFEWRDLHRDELLANWNRLRNGEAAEPIAPLE
jgi:uncharacterized protein DUF4160/uncharacterized protein DUF2442